LNQREILISELQALS